MSKGVKHGAKEKGRRRGEKGWDARQGTFTVFSHRQGQREGAEIPDSSGPKGELGKRV